jgi:adenosylcobinamide-phosphate synthase
MLLDAVFGEPNWLWSRLPHPAVVMGRAVNWFDQTWNHGRLRRLKGVLSLLVLCGVALGLGFAIPLLPVGGVLETVVVAVLLAQKSLVQHVRAVATGLRYSVETGRRAVAMIVGRDTRDMDAPAIARAAIESAAENVSDGVIAPIFWYAVAGLPGLLVYKVTNTADSMIGYRTARHQAFGWAAARFDDLLNLVPARATALMIALAYGQLGSWRGIVADARRHRSPNAGWPEAAMARALGVALSGPRSYEGQMRDFPFVFPEGRRDAGAADIEASTRVLWVIWAMVLGVALLVWISRAF